ncbi:hypothetical protein [Streptococcus suis]|uniref:hypothetical protein n=1 Tax=Streptococcus suis TaxID=1307 RepID=UPI001478E4A5|nr:hypothetical protein [Streptococcus suis]
MSTKNKTNKFDTLQEIEKSFSTYPGFVGIDAISLQFTSDIYILNNFNRNIIKLKWRNTTLYINYHQSGNIKRLSLKSNQFGKITIEKEDSNSSQGLVTIDLITEHINIRTSSILEIQNRILELILEISKNTEINIKVPTTNNIVIKEIEIAFTFASLNRIHLQTRLLLFRCFINDPQPNLKRYDIKSDSEDYHIIESCVGKFQKYVFYDKTAKLINDGYLRDLNNYTFRIYRLEITLKKSKVTNELYTNILSDLQDENIINFLKQEGRKAFNNYINLINESIKQTDAELEFFYHKNQSYDYIDKYLINLINNVTKHITVTTLDEEIFIYLKLSYMDNLKNKARTIRTFLKKSMEQNDIKEYYLSEMISWQTLLLLNYFWKFLSYISNSKKSLSVPIPKTNGLVYVLQIKRYNNNTRLKVFEGIIRRKTKSTTVENVIKERWRNLDLSKVIKKLRIIF